MFGAYAHIEGDDDSVSASGTFDLASLVGSTKNHKRRLGSRGSTAKVPKPVRMGGASCKKTLPTPTRRVMTVEGAGSSVVSNLGSRLAAIDENTLRREEKDARADVSLSDLMGGMGLATPSQHGIKIRSVLDNKQTDESSVASMDKENSVVREKVSPDSGSFTMSSTKTRGMSSSVKKDYTGDFTDSLPAVSRHPANTSNQGHSLSKPVKMMVPVKTGLGSRPAQRFPIPVRSKTVATDKNVDKSSHAISSEPLQQQMDKEKDIVPEVAQEPMITRDKTSTSDIHQRLQALSSGGVGASGRDHLPEPPPLALSRAQTLPPAPSLQAVTPIKPPQVEVPAEPVTPIKPPQVPADPAPRAAAVMNTMPPPSSSSSRDKVLTVRGKRYRVMKVLGKGGSSRVYEAFDEEKSTVVAIKRVDLSDADDAQREGGSYHSVLKILFDMNFSRLYKRDQHASQAARPG